VPDAGDIGHVFLSGLVGVVAAHAFLRARQLGDAAEADGGTGNFLGTGLHGLSQLVGGAVR